MTDIILDDGKLIPLTSLPSEMQIKIKQLAIVDHYKDQARAELEASQIDIDKSIELWLKSKAGSKYTTMAYHREAYRFIEWLEIKGINPLLIEYAEADEYTIYLKEIGLSSNSIRTKLSILSSLYSFLKRHRQIKQNPFIGVNYPKKEYKHKNGSKLPSSDDIEKILTELKKIIEYTTLHISERNRQKSAKQLYEIINVILDTGLRIGSIPSLVIEEEGWSATTKGDKYITGEITEYMKCLGRKPFVGIKPNTVSHSFGRLMKELGLDHSIHDLRHYFAMNLYKVSKDIVLVKERLGHSSINVTDVYLNNLV